MAGSLEGFSLPDYGFGIGFNAEQTPGLWYRIKRDDLQHGNALDWQFIWDKMGTLIDTLSIVDIGNYWLDERLWCEGKLVWERPRGVPVVAEKEAHPDHPLPPIKGPYLGVAIVNLIYHIANSFPRVWLYHQTGCYLLRSAFPGQQWYGDILLNFFKIGELITATMYHTKPHLKEILRASKELGVDEFYDQSAVTNFYRVRSRDSAHDWLKVQPVQRPDALDCKMWAELMIQNHWHKLGQEVARVTEKAAAEEPA